MLLILVARLCSDVATKRIVAVFSVKKKGVNAYGEPGSEQIELPLWHLW
jgi:hypothetical protein